MTTAKHLLTGAVVFPLVWIALAALIVAEALARAASRLTRAWR